MRKADFDAFSQMLDAVCGLLSRGTYVPSPANTAMFFRALAKHSLDEVRAGFDAHVSDPQRGRFVPVPADILAQIEGLAANDGRPGADEAWAIALRAADEAETVVWTAEASQAWAIARPVLDSGDEVGARMAFRDAYNRLVEQARQHRQPATWSTSIGFDPQRREAAITAAVEAGRLPASELPQLPAPRAAVALLGMTAAAGIPEHAREALERFREAVRQKRLSDAPGVDGLAKQQTAELKHRAAEQVRWHADRAQLLGNTEPQETGHEA